MKCHPRDRFQIIREIGRGGLGVVYLAHDKITDRDVALKRIDLEGPATHQADYLKSEFKVLAGLSHPNLVAVHDFGNLNDDPKDPELFFTAEFVDGKNIREAAKRLKPDEIYDLIAQVARGLAYIHARGVIHGDIKPQNILVTEQDGARRVKILDFGLAKVLGQSFHPSGGTFAYMAPEVPHGVLTKASDLYSLGVVIFELVTKKHPLRAGGTISAIKPLAKQLSPREIPDPRTIDPTMPIPLAQMILRLTAQEPHERYSSANLVIRTLNRLTDRSFGEEATVLTAPDPQAGPLVARDEEFSRLKSILKMEKSPRVVFIVGEAGTGKSRLIREFRIHCQVSLISFEERQMLDEMMGTGRRIIHFTNAAEATLSDGEKLRNPSPDTTILADIRPEAAPVWMQGMIDAPPDGINVIRLSPFTPEQTRQFLEEVAGGIEISELFHRRLYDLTGGNPGLLTELIRQLASTIPPSQLDDAAKSLTRDDELLRRLPRIDRVEEGLLHEYSEATPQGRVTLEFLSLSRTPLSLSLLERMTSLAVEPLLEELKDLERRRLVRLQHGATGVAVSLDHELMREAVTDALASSEREAKHRKIAECLERERPVSDATIVELAYHWDLGEPADDSKKSLRYNLEAASILRRNRDWRGAIVCIERALARGADEREGLEAALAGLYDRIGNFRRAAELYGGLAGGTKAASRKVMEGIAWQKAGDLERAIHAYHAALTDNPQGCDTDEVQRIEGLIAMALVQLGRYDEAAATCREALARGGSQKNANAATIHNALGLASFHQGDVHAAVEHYGKSLSIYESIRFEPGIANAANNLGMAYHQAKNAGEAFRFYQRAHTIATRLNDRPFATTILANIATIHQEKGRYAEALAAYQEALANARKIGDNQQQAALTANLAALHVLFGASDRATSLVAETLDTAPSHLFPIYEAFAESIRGDMMMNRGAWNEAATHYGKAVVRYHVLKMRREAFHAELAAVDALIEEKKIADAEQKLGGLPKVTSLGISGLDLELDWQNARLALTREPADLETAGSLCNSIGRYLAVVEQPERNMEFHFVMGKLRILEKKDGAARREMEAAAEILQTLAHQVPEEFRDDYLGTARRKRVLQQIETLKNEPKEEGPSMPTPPTDPKRLNRLIEINRRLNSERDVPRLLEAILDTAIELTAARRGFLILFDKKGGRTFDWKDVKVARNFDRTSIAAEEIELSASVVNQVLASGKVLLTDNAAHDTRLIDYKSVHDLHLNSIVAVPLKSDRQIRGVLYLDHPTRSRLFSPEDVELVSGLADLSAVALRNVTDITTLAATAEEAESSRRKLARSVKSQSEELDRLKQELSSAKGGAEYRYSYANIIGQSDGMHKLFKTLDRITETKIPVFVHGESGTGKELIAKALHYNSPRKTRHFVSENCTAIPENLLESELFGHVKGAFTGADRAKEGLFRHAHGGTLFLDEIGDMPLALQSKLLRVLQEEKVRPVGGSETIAVDVRIVSASHRNLKELVAAGQFRQDLFFRLNGITVTLPPLRERREDIPLLVRHFLDKWGESSGRTDVRVPPTVMDLLINYPWPGNIRELEQTIRNAVLFASHGVIDAEVLSFKSELFARRVARPIPPSAEGGSVDLGTITDDRERVIAALKKCRFNKSEAAKALGVTRKTLYNKMARYGITENINLL